MSRLKAAGIVPRKRLGQHFLHDPKLLDSLVEAAAISRRDAVFEVGTGAGTLTRHLAARARRVLSVEVDERLAAFARRELLSERHVEVLHADALSGKRCLNPLVHKRLSDLGEFVWVSNLPYAVAAPLILTVLEAGLPWNRCVLTLQVEVAERLSASPGDRNFSSTTALVAFWASARTIRRIGAGSFWPRPRVDSAAVALEPRRPPLDPSTYPGYKGWVQFLFRSRRKQLRARLRERLGDAKARRALALGGWEPRRRPESLGLEDFLLLAENFPSFSH